MRDSDWLEPTDDDHDGDGQRRARPLLFALASVPWLVVIALLVLPGRIGAGGPWPGPGSAAQESREDQESQEDRDAGHPDQQPAQGSDDQAAPGTNPTDLDPGSDADDGPRTDRDEEVIVLDAQEIRGGWRVEAGPEEAVALAVVAGRAWLTGVEPLLDLGLAPDQRPAEDVVGYAEHLIVEAVEQPAADAVVVTLVAVVLDAAGGSAPSVRRLAVPVALTAQGPRLAGTPWDLPPPVLERVTLPRQVTTDIADLDAARDALIVAGLTELELVGLHRTDGWPVIAEVVTPGTDLRHEVWLRPHVNGFVVAGTTLAGAAVAPTTEPTAEPTPEPLDDRTEAQP